VADNSLRRRRALRVAMTLALSAAPPLFLGAVLLLRRGDAIGIAGGTVAAILGTLALLSPALLRRAGSAPSRRHEGGQVNDT
jgi:hypothetical protein